MPEGKAPCATPPRPRIPVTAFRGVARVAEHSRPTGDDAGLAAPRELTTAHPDRPGPALAGNRHGVRPPVG